MLTIHLYQHENLPEADYECSYVHLGEHRSWTDKHAATVVQKAQREKIINRADDILALTDKGRELAKVSLVQ